MQLKSILLSLAAVSAVVAIPTPDSGDIPEMKDWKPWSCLRSDQAEAIVNTFIQAEQTNGNETTTFNALIESVANSDDQEISDSINFFTGQAYGSVTEPNLAAIEAGHAHAGNGVYQITTLNIWHTCRVITWRWRFVLFPGATPVQGFDVFVLGDDGKIDQTYIEFNSAVWAKDIGFTVTPPPGFVGKK
jgi:hypothetical protein